MKGSLFKCYQSSYLEVFASFEQPVFDLGQLVVAEVEGAQKLEVLELSRAEHGVEVVAEKVVAQLDDLQGVLDAVKEPLGQPPDLVVAEVCPAQRNVARGEELRAQRLEAGILHAVGGEYAIHKM